MKIAAVFRATALACALAVGSAGMLPAQGRGNAPPDRAALQRQVRQALARVTRERLGLNDAQMSQLADVDRKFQPRRQSLTRDETLTRQALASAMADTAHVDQAKIGGYLDHLLDLQRQRLDLQRDEQKALSGFLTPLQRAQYQALQERMRRKLDQMRPAPGGQGARSLRPRRPPPPR